MQAFDNPPPPPATGQAQDASPLFTGPRHLLAERLERGRQLRKRIPRKDQALYPPVRTRRSPLELIRQQNGSRVEKLVPIRNARMRVSPFAFFRGNAAIMAGDLAAATPVTGIDVFACGDMHVANFGVFASAERNLIFAINDFDEVHPGPWEWDLKRLVASAAIAARHLGGDDTDAAEAARAAAGGYRYHIREYARMGYLDTWYDCIDEQAILQALPGRARERARKVLGKARTRGHVRTLERMTETVDGRLRILESPPLIVRETHRPDGTPVALGMDLTLRSYMESLDAQIRFLLSRFRIVDVARKVVGVGSVGTSCWVSMLLGADDEEPLFLQVKEAQPSVLAAHLPGRSPFANEGQRVVAGQRLIQGSPDIFLGWGNGGHDFYVRQLADMKGGISLEEGDRGTLDGFPAYCGLCGWALALAHAKSGDAALIAGYCGSSEALDEALAGFALAYERQNASDHEHFVDACRRGAFRCEKDS